MFYHSSKSEGIYMKIGKKNSMEYASLKSVVGSECRMGKLHELRNEFKFKAHQNIRQNYNLFIYNCASSTQTAGTIYVYIDRPFCSR